MPQLERRRREGRVCLSSNRILQVVMLRVTAAGKEVDSLNIDTTHEGPVCKGVAPQNYSVN